jgi:epoxyqueuosine reductase QueG
VCPWNLHAPRTSDPVWQPRREWDAPTLATLAETGDDALERGLRGSAMQRAGVKGLRRNVTAALAAARGGII